MDCRLTAMLIVILMVSGVLHTATAYCCSKKAPNIASHIAVCRDCTLNEWCCAHGKCDFFCCSCEGGCRDGRCWDEHPKGKRDVVHMITPNGNYTFSPDESTGYSIVMEGDANGDGLLGIEEAHVMLLSRGVPASLYRGIGDLHAMDVNGDKYLSPLEIDPDADNNDDE